MCPPSKLYLVYSTSSLIKYFVDSRDLCEGLELLQMATRAHRTLERRSASVNDEIYWLPPDVQRPSELLKEEAHVESVEMVRESDTSSFLRRMDQKI